MRSADAPAPASVRIPLVPGVLITHTAADEVPTWLVTHLPGYVGAGIPLA